MRHLGSVATLLAVLVIGTLVISPLRMRAQAGPPMAMPELYAPFAGDARLEPIPDGPLLLKNLDVFTTDQFGNPHTLTMRFPPRVNGQNQSDGDKHADMYVLFDAATGALIDQPMIIEAAPKNAAGPGFAISDLQARLYSPIWELTAVTVDSTYVPGSIDSVAKIFSSTQVKEIIQTNIFLNCPIVPRGTVVDPGSNPPEDVFFEGQRVTIVPYDIEDGGFNVQILFKFEDAAGNTLGRTFVNGVAGTPTKSAAGGQDFMPHLVTSHAIGDPFYTSIWDVWTVVVPNDANVADIVNNVKSNVTVRAMVASKAWSVKSSGIRLNCPVVKVDGVTVPPEDAVHLLADANHIFRKGKFPFDVAATTFTKPRTFQITEIDLGGAPLLAPAHAVNGFPDITPEIEGKGNVIPLILEHPFQAGGSGPATNGSILRLNQEDLEAAYHNVPPRLPQRFEDNIAALIAAGNLDASWAPGIRPYQERLAAIGRAYFELVWMPEQGANQKDVTTCLACHSLPAAGGSARGLYSLERAIAGANSGSASRSNPGSMFGSGAAQLLVSQLSGRGYFAGDSRPVVGAHGSQGQIVSMRATVSGANNTHFGIESVERIVSLCAGANRPAACGGGPVTFAQAATLDLDGDGVANELTVGEVTAEAAFLLTLAAPDEAADRKKADMGITAASVERGRSLFRRRIANGGLECASCHRVFHKFDGGAPPVLMLDNPQDGFLLPLTMPYHGATVADVNYGDADYFGQPGLRTYGDFRRHQMGTDSPSDVFFAPTGQSLGLVTGSTTAKSAELWDVGVAAPLLRTGDKGFDIKGVILGHGGEGRASRDAFAQLAAAQQTDVVNFLRVQLIRSQNGEGSGALPPNPQPVPGAAPAVPAIVARDNSLVTVIDTPVAFTGASLLANDSGSVLMLGTLDTTATRGLVTRTGPGTFTYTPPAGVRGFDGFTYSVFDSFGQRATAAVRITINHRDGLVAAYAFDEVSGSTALDVSGRSNNGTIAGAVRTAGKVGGALSFDGATSLVSVPDSASLRLSTGMTVEAWVNPSQLGGWRTVLLKERVGGLTYGLYADDGSGQGGTPGPAGYLYLDGVEQPVRGPGNALPLNGWTHLAVTYDWNVCRLYVNGVLVGTSIQGAAIGTAAGALRIGGNSIWGEFFSGLIDEVRVYNRALSGDEIVGDMSIPVTPPGL